MLTAHSALPCFLIISVENLECNCESIFGEMYFVEQHSVLALFVLKGAQRQTGGRRGA